MGRIKRGYTRVIPPDELKRDYRLFAIACEGHREKEYLEQFEGISRRVIVEYIKDEDYPEDPPSAPAHVLRRAIKYVESNALNDEDSIWLVMDVDKWGDKILNEIHDYCQQQSNWRIIISNPCFEIWLLYHTRANLEGLDFNTILFDYYIYFVPYYINLFSSLFTFIAVIFVTSKLAFNSILKRFPIIF